MSELYRYGIKEGVIAELQESQDMLGWGKESVVERIPVTVFGENGRTKTISLAEKLLREKDPQALQRDIERLFEAHHRLQEAGIATFPTMRIEKGDSPRLFTTDLSRGGKHAILSLPDFWGPRGEIEEGKLHDHHIFHLSNPHDASGQLKRIFEKANSEGIIVMGIGAPFLDINNDTSEGKILVGDLSNVRFDQKKNSLFTKTMNMGVRYTYCAMMNSHLDIYSRLKMHM